MRRSPFLLRTRLGCEDVDAEVWFATQRGHTASPLTTAPPLQRVLLPEDRGPSPWREGVLSDPEASEGEAWSSTDPLVGTGPLLLGDLAVLRLRLGVEDAGPGPGPTDPTSTEPSACGEQHITASLSRCQQRAQLDAERFRAFADEVLWGPAAADAIGAGPSLPHNVPPDAKGRDTWLAAVYGPDAARLAAEPADSPDALATLSSRPSSPRDYCPSLIPHVFHLRRVLRTDAPDEVELVSSGWAHALPPFSADLAPRCPRSAPARTAHLPACWCTRRTRWASPGPVARRRSARPFSSRSFTPWPRRTNGCVATHRPVPHHRNSCTGPAASQGLAFGRLDPSSVFVDAALCVWLPPPLPVGAALPPSAVPVAVAAPAPLPSGTGLACVSAQWSCGAVSNLDYLLTLNYAAGRRIGDCASAA